jgi:hypothetical protein
MALNDTELRKSLHALAAQVAPAQVAPSSLSADKLAERVRRRRARVFTAAAGGAAAVAALAIALPLTLSSPGQQSSSAPAPPQLATAGTGPWGSKLACGDPVTSRLPGPAGGGIRLTIRAISRGTSGGVQVIPYTISTLPANAGPPMGPVQTVLLVLHQGVIAAAETIPQGSGNFMVPAVGLRIPAALVRQDAPRITACQPVDWQTVWDHAAEYQVAVLQTAWIAGGGRTTDYRLAATAPLSGS